MSSVSISLAEATQQGLVHLGDRATIADSVRIVPHEDDGVTNGPIVIGAHCRIRDGVVICSGVNIGENTIIGHNSVIRTKAIIGKDCVISHMVCIEQSSQIGQYSRISALTHLTGGFYAGERVEIGARVVTINDGAMEWHGTPKLIAPRVENNAKIGSGAILMSGVTIGEGALVGAGSLVLSDIPPQWTAYGHPAYPQTPRTYINPLELHKKGDFV